MKKLITYILILTMSVLLTACNNNGNQYNVKDNKINLEGTITVWSSGNEAKALREIGDKFTKEYPKVKVEVKEINEGNSYDSITSALALGTNAPDIFTIEGERAQELTSKFSDKLVDLTSEISSNNDKYVQSKLMEISMNKKIYAYPWTTKPIVIYYRNDIFKAAGINPEDIKTWDQYIEAGEIIAINNKDDIKMIAAKDTEWLYRVLLCQLGTGYYDTSGKPVLDSNASNKAMIMVKKLKEANLIYNYSDTGSLINELKSGKLAAFPMDAQSADILKQQCSDLSGKWSVMELPAFECGGKTAAAEAGCDIMLTSSSKNKEAAKEFARYASMDPNVLQDLLVKYGMFSCYLPELDDQIFETKIGYFGGQKAWMIYNMVTRDVKQINYTPNYTETQQLVRTSLNNIIDKNQEIESGLHDLQKDDLSKFSK